MIGVGRRSSIGLTTSLSTAITAASTSNGSPHCRLCRQSTICRQSEPFGTFAATPIPFGRFVVTKRRKPTRRKDRSTPFYVLPGLQCTGSLGCAVVQTAMTDTHATTTIAVSATCEDGTCRQPAEVAVIVTGEYGTDDVASYCNECAADRDNSSNHTAISTVEIEEVPSSND